MTTDTIPEDTREFAKSLWGGRNIGDEAYFVERVLTHFATLQKQCSSLETALADWHKMADQRSEALIKAQQQCEELRHAFDMVRENEGKLVEQLASEKRLRETGKAVTQGVWKQHEEQFAALTKERDDLRTRLAELEKAEQQFEEAAKMSFDLAAEKRSVQDQLTRLQQDVKPLVSCISECEGDGGCRATKFLATFLTAHPECKP